MSHPTHDQEESTWAIPDYDPWLEAQITEFQEAERLKPREIEQPEPEIKHPSSLWLVAIAGGLVAATFLFTPRLAKLGSGDDKPVKVLDVAAMTNQLNCEYLRPRLINAAGKVLKFAAKHPSTSEKQVREDRIITLVSGQDDGDEGKIRLVTERHGDSRKPDSRSALSLGIVHKSDDGSGNRVFESVLIAAPSGEKSLTRPYGRANKWLAHERTSYTSSGSKPMTDQSSSTKGESSSIADNTQSILEGAVFAINFEYNVSKADPKDQDHSCNQLATTPQS